VAVLTLRVTKATLEWLREARLLFEGYPQHPRLQPGNLIKFHDTCITEPYSAIYSGFNIFRMGAFSFCHSELPPDTIVGRYCSLSWNIRVPGPNHPTQFLTTSPIIYDKDFRLMKLFETDAGEPFTAQQSSPQKAGVRIGHDVWIGQDVSIMRGITIGNGAVVAASAVVTRDVAPYEIVGGNPARRIRLRFDEAIVQELQDIQWWKYSLAHLEKRHCQSIRSTIDALKVIKNAAASQDLTVRQIALKELPGEAV
jgi:acetyltransferase-like isoleucine patch superfamily enzyme